MCLCGGPLRTTDTLGLRRVSVVHGPVNLRSLGISDRCITDPDAFSSELTMSRFKISQEVVKLLLTVLPRGGETRDFQRV